MQAMFRLITVSTLLLGAQLAGAEEAAIPDPAQSASENAGFQPAYPAWPERPVQKNPVPPPPPGPYMSTALTYAGQGFSCCPGSEEETAREQTHSPLFKSMQWPERGRPPQRWRPEGGEYSYAPEDYNAADRKPATAYGYQPAQPWMPIYPPPPPPRYYR